MSAEKISFAQHILKFNISFDNFSLYGSFTQDNRRIACDINKSGRLIPLCFPPVQNSINFVANLPDDFGSQSAFRHARLIGAGGGFLLAIIIKLALK